jgi:uncharacterized repeat protein (TIGR01451 family)
VRKGIIARSRLLLALAALAVLSVGGSDSVQANHTGGMDAMSVDMNPAATPANSPTSLGSREGSARINENDILDADEDVVDGIFVDITATNIPASNPMTGFGYRLSYGAPPAPSLCISDRNNRGLLLSESGSELVAAADPMPDCDGGWNSEVVDVSGTAPESGSGFLERLTLTTSPGVISGTYVLTLTNAAHFKDNGIFAADAVYNGLICVNQLCQDLEVTSTTVSSPGGTSVGSFFDVLVDAVLRNNGPAALVKADITATSNLPSDCQATGGNVRMVQDQLLFASTDFEMPRQTFSVSCNEPGTHTFTANASVVEDDPTVVEDNLSNNSAVSPPVGKSVIGSSDIVVTKVDSADPVAVGSNFQYTIRAKNNGPHPARGLLITDLLPNADDGDGRGDETFVDAILGFDYDGDGIPEFTGAPCEPGMVGAQPNPSPPPPTYNSTLRCSITPTRTDNLPVNASVFLTVTVTETGLGGTTNINIARASFSSDFGETSPSVDPDGANEPDCAGVISLPANAGCERTIADAGNGDGDGDTVINMLDNCPITANPDQQNADADPPGDACDNCPGTTNADQANSDSDAAGNACDNCPSVSNAAQTDTDGDNAGDACDPDDDNDSVCDAGGPLVDGTPGTPPGGCTAGASGSDNCVATSNPTQADADADAAGDACDPCAANPDCDSDSNIPPGYTSCKGTCPGGFWRDGVELRVGTSPVDRCANTATLNDEADDKWPPDFNDDQKNNVLDFALWKSDFPSLSKPYNRRADLNADGVVNVLDFAIWKAYFFAGAACVP